MIGLQIWRTLILAASGLAVGLAISEAYLYLLNYRFALRCPARSAITARRLLGMICVRVGTVFGACFVLFAIATSFNRPEITWRAPLATVLDIFWIVGMLLILGDDARHRPDPREGEDGEAKRWPSVFPSE